jgi:hypothetical protein
MAPNRAQRVLVDGYLCDLDGTNTCWQYWRALLDGAVLGSKLKTHGSKSSVRHPDRRCRGAAPQAAHSGVEQSVDVAWTIWRTLCYEAIASLQLAATESRVG